MTAGIIDPTKVVRVALQDDASIAGLLIPTEGMVADRRETQGPTGYAAGRWNGWHGLLSWIIHRAGGHDLLSSSMIQ